MHTHSKIVLLIGAIIIIIFDGIFFFSLQNGSTSPVDTQGMLQENEARVIGERACLKNGERLMDGGTYDKDSKTWSFEIGLNEGYSDCPSECLIFEKTQTAEVLACHSK